MTIEDEILLTIISISILILEAWVYIQIFRE